MIRIGINWETYGWKAAIHGMRNPMNSWDRSDSWLSNYTYDGKGGFVLGNDDLNLAKKLCKAGSDHSKFRRMIHVNVDIKAPLYWWKEFDTYKIGTVANSCSTMHKIGEKEFTKDDFSIEHLGVHYTDIDDDTGEERTVFQNLWIDKTFQEVLDGLNIARNFYLKTEDPDLKKKYWWQMIQLLPTSYNQKRTIDINYQVLSNMYQARKDHKLDEWRDFCHWITSLPYANGLIFDDDSLFMDIVNDTGDSAGHTALAPAT